MQNIQFFLVFAFLIQKTLDEVYKIKNQIAFLYKIIIIYLVKYS